MEEKSKNLKEELTKYYEWFNKGTRSWSFAYHLCLYTSIISTLLIGFISQMDEFSWIGISSNIFVSFLAFLSAVLTGIIAKGGLDRKWKSNRINRGKVDCLRLELILDDKKTPEIVSELKTIITDHDKVIVGVNLELKEENK